MKQNEPATPSSTVASTPSPVLSEKEIKEEAEDRAAMLYSTGTIEKEEDFKKGFISGINFAALTAHKQHKEWK